MLVSMRRRIDQNDDETAKPVELCRQHRVLQEPSSSGCKNRRVLRKPSSSARIVEFFRETSNSKRTVEFCDRSNSAEP